MVWRAVRGPRQERWYSIARSTAFALIITVDIFARPIIVSCQPSNCNHVPENMELPNPQGWVKMLPENSTCTDNSYLDMHTENVPNGAYLKAGMPVRIDTEAHTTGTCYQYMFNWWLWQCQYSGIAEMQALQKVDIFSTPPGLLTTHTTHNASYPSRSLDTRNLQLVGTIMGELGEWTFTFQSTAYATACTLAMSSNVITKTVNVLQCGPKFWESGGQVLHLPATTIEIYVPNDMYILWNPAIDEGPLRDVVNAYNNIAALRDLGLNLHLTTTPCSGGACILLQHGPMRESDDACAETGLYPSGSSRPAEMTLTDGNQDPPVAPWNLMGDDFQRYLLAHEIGHTLGLGHPVLDDDCWSAEQSVMTPPNICGQFVDHFTPTINDISPILKSVFGSGTKTKCGFPVPPPPQP
jgi:hypothetical protein